MWGDDTLIAHHQWKNITEIVSGVFAERRLYLKDSAMGNTRCMGRIGKIKKERSTSKDNGQLKGRQGAEDNCALHSDAVTQVGKDESSVLCERSHVMQAQATNVLGESTLTALGLVHFSVTTNFVNNTCTGDMINWYTHQFQGIWKMKDSQVKLHIGKIVKPVNRRTRHTTSPVIHKNWEGTQRHKTWIISKQNKLPNYARRV